MELLLIWIGLGVVAAIAAQGRGRSFGLWLVLGLVFGVFALIAVLVMPTAQPATPAAPAFAPTPRASGSAASPSQGIDWYLEGSGDYDFDIVGESHRQEALAAIAGPKTDQGVEITVDATIQRDLHNANDPNAIAVRIGGRHVGYVPRDDAAELADLLHQKGLDRAQIRTSAIITGGWRRMKGGKLDEGSFGVRLDVSYPFTLETASARRRRIAAESDA